MERGCAWRAYHYSIRTPVCFFLFRLPYTGAVSDFHRASLVWCGNDCMHSPIHSNRIGGPRRHSDSRNTGRDDRERALLAANDHQQLTVLADHEYATVADSLHVGRSRTPAVDCEWGPIESVLLPEDEGRGGRSNHGDRYAFVDACEVAARRLRAESQRVMSMSFGHASLQLKMV